MKKVIVPKMEVSMTSIWLYWIYLLVVWGFFRLTWKLDDLTEELIIKPLVWGWPVIAWQIWGRTKIKVYGGNMLRAIFEGVILGLGFALILVLAKVIKAEVVVAGSGWRGLESVDLVSVALATAVVEETIFAGFILGHLRRLMGNEKWAMGVTTLMFASLHLPIGSLIYGYGGLSLLGFLTVVALVAVAKYNMMLRVNNLWAPIVAHWIWSIAIWALG